MRLQVSLQTEILPATEIVHANGVLLSKQKGAYHKACGPCDMLPFSF